MRAVSSVGLLDWMGRRRGNRGFKFESYLHYQRPPFLPCA